MRVPLVEQEGFATLHGRRDGKFPGKPAAAIAAMEWLEGSGFPRLFGETVPLATPSRAASWSIFLKNATKCAIY